MIKCCDRYFEQTLVHTGQNYDYTLNQVFFDDLGLRAPDYYLDAAGDDLGATIGNIIDRSYKLMARLRPDAVLVLGDTNSCLPDMLKGFELGADDYVTKPFPISVFQKKVSALLNRISAQSGGDFYDDGNLYINFSELSACLAGQPITLTSLEYRLLKVLTRNSQTVLTRQVLLEKLWDIDENYVDEHALTTTISRIRSKIETNQHSYIKTVYGMGYMWIGGAQK